MIQSSLLNELNVKHGFCGVELTFDGVNLFDSATKINEFNKKVGVQKTIFLRQVHSNKISHINSIKKSDGIIINQKNIAIALKTADCVPLLLFDDVTKTIGALHVGSKGAYRGIVENGIEEFKKFGSKNLYVAIGPSISWESYEVQDDFLKLFRREYFHFIDDKKYFDLKKCIKDKIYEFKKDFMKIVIDDVMIDTFKTNEFHSYRREKKTPLRNVSYIAT